MTDFFSMYSYATFTLYFLVVWAILFYMANADNRREMLHLSFAGFLVGGVIGPIYTVDWWMPVTIFSLQTPLLQLAVSPEDLLFGFAVFGISSVLFEVAFKKQEVSKSPAVLLYQMLLTLAILILALVVVLLTLAFFGFHSLLATLFGTLIVFTYLLWNRTDLFIPIILGALLLCLVALPGYLLVIFLNPDWITSEWMLHNLSGYYAWGIPIEEFIWYTLVAMAASCVWEKSRQVRFK